MSSTKDDGDNIGESAGALIELAPVEPRDGQADVSQCTERDRESAAVLVSPLAANADVTDPVHIIGIGASAGGLSALQHFFDKMPPDSGAAFVVVQHLSPNFKTLMDELLSRHSSMKVKLADDGEKLAANHVYLLRPNRSIAIKQGALVLKDRELSSNPNMPIDKFFSSLARDTSGMAVGIILSGTGSDGSIGIKALREAGGLVLVQEPTEAEFDGMPVAAIRTGYVDSVGEVGQLVVQLEAYIKNWTSGAQDTEFREHLADNQETLDIALAKLRVESGVDFSLYKPAMVARRIEHRMGICNVKTLPEYVKVLEQKPGEFSLLKSDLLIGVTQFFRDQGFWEEIIQPLLASLVKRKSDQEGIRVWMVGVSSGEEVYSLAIMLTEYLQAHSLNNPIKIFATDVNSHAVDYASMGVYPPQICRDIGEERLARFFNRDEGGNYVINPKLRNMVVFATHNVLEDPPFSNLDLVVCRNMLIYFLPEAQERVFGIFNFALRNGGHLWLGSAETIPPGDDSFEEVSSAGKLWSKVSSSRRLMSPYMAAEKLRHQLPATIEKTRNRLSQTNYSKAPVQQGFNHSIRNRVLEKFGPTGILLTKDLHVNQVFGDCRRFMGFYTTGQLSTHINSLLAPALMVSVATCVAKVVEESHERFSLLGVPLEMVPGREVGAGANEEQENCVDVTIEKQTDLIGTGEVFYLILFNESVASPSGDSPSSVVVAGSREKYNADLHTQERLRELDLKLLDSKQELQNAYAELDTTSEELQATNEELMAANEELQSTNEELQSVNEELFSVNTEYQEKIAELMESNTDLDNLLNSTGYGIIFLDSTLAIRRYTPKISKYIHLLPGDVERPITDFNFDIKYDELINDMNTVLQAGSVIVKKLTTRKSGIPIVVSINPYISTDKSVNGVVMTIQEPELEGTE